MELRSSFDMVYLVSQVELVIVRNKINDYGIHLSINSNIHVKMYTSHNMFKIGVSFKTVHKISQHIMTEYVLLL